MANRNPPPPNSQPPASAITQRTTSDLPPASTDDRPSASAEVRGDLSGGGPAPPSGTNPRDIESDQNTSSTNPKTRRVSPSNPRVLILTGQQTKLSSLSPFQRKDGCDRMGKILRCDKLRDGSLEVEFESGSEASRALLSTTFVYSVRDKGVKRDAVLPITVSPHRSKNFRKGIITCYDLRDTSNDEIAEGLASFGVVEASKILTKRRGNTIPTNSVILTFDSTDLPSAVTVGYTRVRVRTYIPNPMRCFKCQRFGHPKTRCDNRPVCAKCSSTEHLDDACDADTLRCANCGDAHASYDRTCPTYLKEKEISAIKATRNISFREAREAYNQSHPAVTYAQKAKAHTSSRTGQSEGPPLSNKTTLERMSAAQLIRLLSSYGLSVVPAGVAPTSAAPVGVAVPVAPPMASATVSAPPSSSSSSSSSGGSAPSAAPAPAAGTATTGEGDDDWILIQGRRSAGRPSTSPPQPAPTGGSSGTPTPLRPSTKESAATAALMRNEEEKRARDARRARMVERARSARRSEEAASAPESGVSSANSSPSGTERQSPSRLAAAPPPADRSPAGPSPMGPPPAPQPLQRPSGPPPPLPTKSPKGERLSKTPKSLPRPLEPPPAPGRPEKRAIGWNGSPSEGDTPRTRHKPHYYSGGSRASSADGRLLPGDGHPRIHFGDGAAHF